MKKFPYATKKKIQRSPVDNYVEITKTAHINTWAFKELQESKNFVAVQAFRERVEEIFRKLDADWIALCGDNEQELTDWGSRMRMVHNNLDTMDRSLAFVGKRQFSWEQVLAAMGLLDALRVATQQTLGLNEK